MTRQEMFDAAYIGLASQGFIRSMSNQGCAYRGDEGRRCAIGWIMPDEAYSPDLEGLSPMNCEIEKALDLASGDICFADELQEAHDGDAHEGDTPEAMKERLESFAIKYNLTVPQVTA